MTVLDDGFSHGGSSPGRHSLSALCLCPAVLWHDKHCQLNKPFIEIYFVFSDSDDEMHGRSLTGCPTHSRFSNEWVPRVTASGPSHHRRKDLIPILSRYDEKFGALVWWARSALHNL